MVAIDTCSLIALVRYYLPFDKDLILFNFIKDKVERHQIIVIMQVFDECKNVAKGVVSETMPFLRTNQTDTSEYLPEKNFFNLTNNNFINGAVKNKLKPEQFEIIKTKWLEGADAKLLLFCLKNKDLLSKPRIITEETEGSNDDKQFKKIPTLCNIVGLETITLPFFLLESGLEAKYKHTTKQY